MDALMKTFTIYDKNGCKNTIQPYSKENLEKYTNAFQNAMNNTVSIAMDENSLFKKFFEQCDNSAKIDMTIKNINSRYKEYLSTASKKDEGFEMKFIKTFMQNLEKEIGFNLEDNIKKVLSQYYATTEPTDEWENTIYIIEMSKEIEKCS